MGIENDDVRRVRDSTDMVKLISQHLQLRKVGRRWTGLCPFHNEKSPSFSVNAEEGLYYCFGCQKSGDAITFVREIEHLDFVGAVEYLAGKAGVQLRYTSNNEGKDRRRRSQLTDTVEAAVEWYHQRLLKAPDAKGARGYLRSRGFDGDLVRQYRVGWAPDDWDVLAANLKAPRDLFVEAGLGFVNRRGRLQDHFRGRVLFPIFDVNNAAVGFGGRILPPDFGGGEGPKYKNSGESSVYNKSRLLYGLNWSKDEIVREKSSIICEGYTDVIGFAQAGMNRAVATCGTALTEDHVKMLKRFAPKIVLAFDADAAGQNAAERIYEWERKYEIDVAVAALPEGVDPADLAREDPEALGAAVEHAQPFLKFRLARTLAASDMTSVEGRARAAQRAVDVVREHPVAMVRDQYLMQIADQCQVSPERLRALLAAPPVNLPEERPTRRRDDGWSDREPPPEAAPARMADNTETQLLRLAVHEPESIPAYIHGALFAYPQNRAIFEALVEAEELHQAIEQASPHVAPLLSQLAVQDEPDGEAETLIGQFLYDAARHELRRLQAAGRNRARQSAEVSVSESGGDTAVQGATDSADSSVHGSATTPENPAVAHGTADLAASIRGLQAEIPRVLEAAFKLDAAERLLPWLPVGAG